MVGLPRGFQGDTTVFSSQHNSERGDGKTTREFEVLLTPRTHHALRLLRVSSMMLAECQPLCLVQMIASLRRRHVLDARDLSTLLAVMLSLEAMAHGNFQNDKNA